MPITLDNYSSAVSAVTYAVNTTGDAMFNSTIRSSDSPNYTTAKTEANTQCVAVSPAATQRVA